MIVGLTGRVGSGKTQAQHVIQNAFSMSIIDLDKVGHEVLSYPHIQHQLDEGLGGHDRAYLSALVFKKGGKLASLNNIVHPELYRQTWIRACGSKKPVLVVGALLKELKLTSLCHHVIVIDAEEWQIKTHIAEKFDKIALHQRSREAYLQEADTVIYNDFSTAFEAHCLRMISQLLAVQQYPILD